MALETSKKMIKKFYFRNYGGSGSGGRGLPNSERKRPNVCWVLTFSVRASVMTGTRLDSKQLKLLVREPSSRRYRSRSLVSHKSFVGAIVDWDCRTATRIFKEKTSETWEEKDCYQFCNIVFETLIHSDQRLNLRLKWNDAFFKCHVLSVESEELFFSTNKLMAQKAEGSVSWWVVTFGRRNESRLEEMKFRTGTARDQKMPQLGEWNDPK